MPRDDPRPGARRRGIELAREIYRWSYDYPPGIGIAARVPIEDRYSISFLSRVFELELEVAANHAASKFADLFDPNDNLIATLGRFSARPSKLLDRVLGPAVVPPRFKQPARLDDYFDMFATIEAPPLTRLWRKGPRSQDLLFGWQRLAGANPMVLRRVERLPDNFPVTDELYRSVIDNDCLDAALAERRLYIADYAILDGIPNGRSRYGEPKYVWAPIALFVQLPATASGHGALVPVAIQCGQRPGPDTPLWTRHDGWRWQMAKTVIQIADGNHHQAVVHLGHTHLTLGAFIIAAHRQLSTRHPIHILLDPHFEFTLAINDTAANNLVAPGGEVEHVLGGTLDGSLAATRTALANFRLPDLLPPVHLHARGLDDLDALPQMPYRDETLPIWAAIRAWVSGYLNLYYTSDATVGADPELQGWIREVSAQDGGRLSGVGAVETVEQLIDVVAFVIWTASAQHSAVNFSQFDFMGFTPNMPGAGYAPAPTADTPNTEQAWLEMLTPIGEAILQADTVYQLVSVRNNQLGDYGWRYFDDRAVIPHLDQFRGALAQLEAGAAARDHGRLLSYPYLRPSAITQSIHI